MDQNTVWVIAIAALIVGALLGFMFGRNGSNGSREIKLAEELDRTQHELAKYRDEVNQHFSVTADLVNDLTNQYQKVHQHLASSAAVLCRDEKLVASLQKQAGIEQKEVVKESTAETAQSEFKMPLDYAERSDKDEPGMLSDRFGLKGEQPLPPSDLSEDRSTHQEDTQKQAS